MEGFPVISRVLAAWLPKQRDNLRYPRGSFYPLIGGSPTSDRRVTKPRFRGCSACEPRSQAPLCLCTPRRISIPPEGTFGRLRYLLGGRRPSQTAHLTLSLARIHGTKLGPKSGKGGIPLAPPPAPEGRLLRLPPILCIPPQSPRPGCSKAPRGLSVPPRVVRVFTDTTVSPGPPPRQRRSRYAFRAGRNFASLQPFGWWQTIPSPYPSTLRSSSFR